MNRNKTLLLTTALACLTAVPLKADPILVEAAYAAGVITAATREPRWKILFDGRNLNAWNSLGDANWKLAAEGVAADAGNGMLVSKAAFRDFELKVEFWADKGTNSGIFLRCSDPAVINDSNCYEANIFDTRPDQSGRTGAITNMAPPLAVVDSEGRWNTYEIRAEGPRLLVKLNGVVTVDMRDGRLMEGPIALQFAKGGVKFRKVLVRRLP